LYTKLEVTTTQGDLLTLQLGDMSTGVNLVNITGLGPVKATLVSTSSASLDGTTFQNAKRGSRNITIQIKLDPDLSVTSVRAARNYVYDIFAEKSQITMKFFADDTDDSTEDGYVIVGHVESCDSDPFAAGIPTIDISVICDDPDFIDPIPVTVTTLTTADTDATLFAYAGTAPTGITFTVNINRTLTEFALYYVDPNLVTWTMDIAYDFEAGDTVTISTVPGLGNKYANLTRAGNTSSILYAVSTQSVWPQFVKGNNWLRFYAEGAAIPTSVTYTKKFRYV
jgi:hypothetical protein